MKTNFGKITCFLAIFLFFMMIASCFEPWAGDQGDATTGTVTINLGGTISRVTYPPTQGMLDDMKYVVSFDRETGSSPSPITFENVPSGELKVTLPLALWTITVEAHFNNELYAQGSGRIRLAPNDTNSLDIFMAPVLPAGTNTAWVQMPNGQIDGGHPTLNVALETIPTTGGIYTIWLTMHQTPAVPYNLSLYASGTRITLRTASQTGVNISFTGTGSLFTVQTGVTLVLTNSVHLFGNTDNTAASLVSISGGTFIMEDGSITMNSGGGVRINSGSFLMEDGIIFSNGNTTSTSTFGGGVRMQTGTFNMSGGVIFDNTARMGGGVYIDNGTFTMTGGTISTNTASVVSGIGGDGGGVHVVGFTLDGTVSNRGQFIRQNGGVIYGGNEVEMNANTAAIKYGDLAGGHAIFIEGVGDAGSPPTMHRPSRGWNNTVNSNFDSVAASGWDYQEFNFAW